MLCHSMLPFARRCACMGAENLANLFLMWFAWGICNWDRISQYAACLLPPCFTRDTEHLEHGAKLSSQVQKACSRKTLRAPSCQDGHAKLQEAKLPKCLWVFLLLFLMCGQELWLYCIRDLVNLGSKFGRVTLPDFQTVPERCQSSLATCTSRDPGL